MQTWVTHWMVSCPGFSFVISGTIIIVPTLICFHEHDKKNKDMWSQAKNFCKGSYVLQLISENVQILYSSKIPSNGFYVHFCHYQQIMLKYINLKVMHWFCLPWLKTLFF